MSWIPDTVVAQYKGYVMGYDEMDEDQVPFPFILYPDGVDSEIVPNHFLREPDKNLQEYVDNKPYHASKDTIAKKAKEYVELHSNFWVNWDSDEYNKTNEKWYELVEAIYGDRYK